jgi:hypothetical protein
MIAAPEPAIFKMTEFERRPAMRAAECKQPNATAIVAKKDQIFAQDSSSEGLPF